jgi:hypothetical protein
VGIAAEGWEARSRDHGTGPGAWVKEHEIDGSLTEVAEPERQVGGVGMDANEIDAYLERVGTH